MSFAALAWAAKQQPGNLAAKMVLLALANVADEHGCAYPSTAAIAEFGSMDHKTATAALDRLAAAGLIVDTGEREGRTKQIKVFRLALERVPEAEGYRKRKASVSSVKAPQKRCTDTVRDTIPVQTTSSQEGRTSDQQVGEQEGQATPAELVEAWNVTAKRHGLVTVRQVTAKRRKAITAVLRQFKLDELIEAIDAVGRAPLCRGEVGSGWRADFDWFAKADNIVKLIEGKYDPAPSGGGYAKPTTTGYASSGRGAFQ